MSKITKEYFSKKNQKKLRDLLQSIGNGIVNGQMEPMEAMSLFSQKIKEIFPQASGEIILEERMRRHLITYLNLYALWVLGDIGRKVIQ